MTRLIEIKSPEELAKLPGSLLPPLDPLVLSSHAPDAHWVALNENGEPAARVSLWWNHTPSLSARPLAGALDMRMGGTGNLPVSPGYQPGGMAEALSPSRHIASHESVSSPFRSAGCRPEQAGSLCYPGKLGVIGHFAAADEGSTRLLLDHACAQLAVRGCTLAVGPMDGNTWRRYRLLTQRGTEPPFFLEPDNPDNWPDWFARTQFTPLATYFSALNDDLSVEDPRLPRTVERLERTGVRLRSLNPGDFTAELRRIYTVSRVSFITNFLYTPIAEDAFLAQYDSIRPHVRPELILLAEQAGEPVGFVFAVPDLAQSKRGVPVDTVVLKTVAVLPGRAYAGLGNVLVADCHQASRALGFRRVIHALMHESNNSLNLSGHYAKPFRRYALFGRALSH